MGNDRYQALFVVRVAQHAFFLKGVDERDIVEGSQRLGHSTGNGIGIGIEQVSCTVVGKWGDDRDDRSPSQDSQHLAVCPVHIAYKTIVDALFDGSAVGLDDVAVGTGHTECVDAPCLKPRDDILVYQSAIDHCHHVERGGIGDTSAVHHRGLYAEGSSHLGGPSPSAVYQNLFSLNGAEVV